MRTVLGLPALALLTACAGGTLDLDEDTQRTCPAARVDTASVEFTDVLFADGAGQTVEFRNGCTARTGDLVLTFTIEGAGGFSTSEASVTLPPGGAVPVFVSYAAVGYDTASATLIAATNDPDVPRLAVELIGSTDPDQDGDTFTAVEAGGTDCDDIAFDINPSAEEIWYDGVDQNCDGASDYDQDGDGFDAGPDADCDDVDASIYPGAREQSDLDDDDCDGWVDEDFLRPNDVVVSEVMADPVAVFDTSGEWFELQNLSTRRLNLTNWRFTDYEGDSFVVSGDLFADPGQRLVFGVDGARDRNGGVSVDYVYSRDAFDLGNARDAVGIEVAGSTVTLLEYDVQWGVEPGASLSLDPMFVARDGATLGKNWCAGVSALPGGDLGTPGGINDVCTSVDHDGDGVSVDDGDCDDGSDTIYPDAPERWNGVDDDCDGVLDNARIATSRAGYLDGYSRDNLSYWNSLSVGDIDGDGDLELMVGTINQGGGRDGVVYTLDAGDAQTWKGGVGGYAEATIEGIGTYNNQALMSGEQRDVDGDGQVDLVIGGTGRLGSGGVAVAVYATGRISGSMDASDADVVWNGGLGVDVIRVASHVDMDGDGVAEIAYGDPFATVGSFYSAGQVWLLDADGASGELSLAEDHEVTWTAGTSTEYIGTTLDGADLDGDGYDELVICGQYADWGATNSGGCAIVDGSKERPEGGVIDEASSVRIGADSFSEGLGRTPTLAIGDFDGDASLDLVLPSDAAGALFVFMDAGSLSGDYDTNDADAVVSVRTGPSALGMSVGVGDIDGDGIDDLVSGAPDSQHLYASGSDEPGRVWVWSGTTVASKSTIGASDAYGWVDGEGVGDLFGWALLVADLDGDGVDDLVTGAPNHGTAAGRVSILLTE